MGAGRGATRDGAVDTRVPPVNVVELLCLDEAAIADGTFPGSKPWPTAELGVSPRSLVQLLVLAPVAHMCMRCAHMQCTRCAQAWER